MSESPSPQVVVAKAQVLAALALRASVEADPAQPRARELCEGSARWLRNVGAWELAVEPAEARVLGAPLGTVSSRELLDCQWAGEEAGVLAWALGLAERPPEWEPVEVAPLRRALRFMQPDGVALPDEVHLREPAELRGYFKRVSLVRWASHEARLRDAGRTDPAALEPLTRALRERLARVGVTLRETDLAAGREEVERIGPAGLSGQSPIPALLVVRQQAAEWLVGGRAALRDGGPGAG